MAVLGEVPYLAVAGGVERVPALEGGAGGGVPSPESLGRDQPQRAVSRLQERVAPARDGNAAHLGEDDGLLGRGTGRRAVDAERGPDPEGRVRAGVRAGDARAAAGGRQRMGLDPAVGPQQTHLTSGSDPEAAPGILDQRSDAQGGAGIRAHHDPRLPARHQSEQARLRRAPERSVARRQQDLDRPRRASVEVLEDEGRPAVRPPRVRAVEASGGPDPERAVRGLADVGNRAVRETVSRREGHERVTVETREPVAGASPEETSRIHHDVEHGVCGEAVGRGVGADRGLLGEHRRRDGQQADGDDPGRPAIDHAGGSCPPA